MKANHSRQNLFAVLAALIWGTSFVAQSVGAGYVEAFTFNAARSAVATVFLFVLCSVLRRGRVKAGKPATVGTRRDLVLGGLCCGTALAVSATLQQKGMESTSSGKARFITAL